MHSCRLVGRLSSRDHVDAREVGKPKSDLNLILLPAINSRPVDLLDSERLLSRLGALERRAPDNREAAAAGL